MNFHRHVTIEAATKRLYRMKLYENDRLVFTIKHHSMAIYGSLVSDWMHGRTEEGMYNLLFKACKLIPFIHHK